ncbi:MAG: DUF3990 domain-containing protein [Cloacibacillus evryensis]
MILYHGGLIPVPEPDLSLSRQQLDFGGGFYTTTSFAQAAKWSKIKSRRDGVPRGYISSYELDESIFKSKIMQIRKFRGPSRAWLTFVMHNRKDVGFAHPYDIVQALWLMTSLHASMRLRGFMGFYTVYAVCGHMPGRSDLLSYCQGGETAAFSGRKGGSIR